MSLIQRIVAPAIGEEKIPSHQFTSLLAEYRRGAAIATKQKIIDQFSIQGDELADLDAILEDYVSSRTSREQIHDALMLGEYGAYTAQQTENRVAATGLQTDLELLTFRQVARIQNLAGAGDFVVRGMIVRAQDPAALAVDYLEGSVLTNNRIYSIAAGSVSLAAADADFARIDLIRVDSSGVVGVTTGTPALTPKPPAIEGGQVALAFVFVSPSATTVLNPAIQDVRVLRSWGPIKIGSRNNPLEVSNNSGVTTLFAQDVPGGNLLLTRSLRVRASGYFLFNSVGNEPNVDWRIRFGSTVLWLDFTSTFTASANRQPWVLDVELYGRTDGTQVLNGTLVISNGDAPNIGSGAINDDQVVAWATIRGEASEDLSIDNTFNFATRMSIADAANTTVVDYATAELI